MKIIVVADDDLKAELLHQGMNEPVTIEWFNDIRQASQVQADACIDLLFTIDPEERTRLLAQLPVNLVVVNDVIGSTEKLPASFVRINGWRTFLQRPLMEAAGGDEKIRNQAVEIFNCFNKKIEWTADVPGFITARIISMLINEAYFALDQQVSSKAEIDIAMKTGTNYPYGPFEWCRLIGIKNVNRLLEKLSRHDPGYQPSALLQTEATL
jgi:3-hydroxybutyryl-CoA dehydrogenase